MTERFFPLRLDGESESDVEMTAATQLRGDVSPLTPPMRKVSLEGQENEEEIQLPPPPPPPGEQVKMIFFFSSYEKTK